MRNSQSIKNDLSKSISKFSKMYGEVPKSNLRQSVLQSRFENIRSRMSSDFPDDNFLGLASNIEARSVAIFN